MPRIIETDEPESYSAIYKGSLISNYPYNRCCPQCLVRWTFGQAPNGMEGVEIEMENCGKAKCGGGSILDFERKRQLRREKYAFEKQGK